MPIPFTFFTDLDEINRRRDNPEFDPDTGMPREELFEYCMQLSKDEAKSRVIRKAEIVAYILDNARLEVSPLDLFADRLDRKDIMEPIKNEWSRTFRDMEADELSATDDGSPCGAYDGNADFGHTCPDWDSLLSLGIPGIIERIERALDGANEEKREFYTSCLIAYNAFRRLLVRFADAYEKHAHSSPTAAQTAENLRAIAEHKPENLMQALELIAIFHRTQHHVEGIVARSLGRLDKLIAPYWVDSEETDEVLRYFLNRMNDRFFYANIPFTIGGVDLVDDEKYEHIALRILEIYETLDIPSPKIQLRVGINTPRSLVTKACEMIQNGTNSIVICNDEIVIEAFLKNGHTAKDARNYVMIGCYEPSTMGCEVSRTCSGNVILAKAVECAMNGGCDMLSGKLVGLPCPNEFSSFDEFYAEVKRQAVYFAEQSMRRIRVLEKHMIDVSPSPLFSGSMQCCIDSGKDAYEGGAKYNVASINVFSVANAADSLIAVKKLVFDDKRLAFTELRDILKNNWEGNEKLRLLVRNKFPKYGNGIAEVDMIAADLLAHTIAAINGKPNNLGGYFRAGGFSVDSRTVYGKRCAASADGRLSGEVLSKNMSAHDGADKNGVTAMIESAGRIDYTDIPNGTVLDLVVHKSAVSGDDGIAALEGIIRTFLNKGGFAIQINVLDPSVLRRAQKEPEKYRNLQVRLCGWNVQFVNLKKNEQDEFIRWSEK